MLVIIPEMPVADLIHNIKAFTVLATTIAKTT